VTGKVVVPVEVSVSRSSIVDEPVTVERLVPVIVEESVYVTDPVVV
jgi:hypothetical protein